MAQGPWSVEKWSDESGLSPESLVRPDQGVLVADATLKGWPITHASRGYEVLTGYSAAELVGTSYVQLHGQETNDDLLAAVREAIGADCQTRCELVVHRKDGSSFLDEIAIFPIADASRRGTQLVSVHTDVSHLRRLEQQLRQSHRMEAAGVLAAGVAHDFNSLLTVINGFSDLLLEGMPQGSGQRDMVEEIRRAGERSAELIRQLLAFSSKQVLAPRLIDLNDIVSRSQALLQPLIGDQIQLVCELQPALKAVLADPLQLEHVLMNLVVNALDAMPAGGRLVISTESLHDERGARVALGVSDTGCGIPDDLKSRLFEPFFTTKGQGQASGLGLSTVYGIVSQSGGVVTVSSELNAGSTFRAIFPAVEAAVEPGRSQSESRLGRGGEVILVVEDECGLRRLVQRVLCKNGYTVLEAENGGAALRLLAEHQGTIDLLLTDLVMPEASGPQVAERALARDGGTRVLYMSGYTDDAVVRRGVSLDQVHFLPKPFSPADLLIKVREVLAI